MRAPRVILWFAMAMLGGCADSPPLPPPERPLPPFPPASTPAKPPLPVALPKEREKQAIDPQKLMGLTEAALRDLLGEPDTVRPEPPALIWSYVSPSCAVDLYFYLELGSETYKTVTFEMTPKGRRGLSGGACLATVQSAAR
jgi:hypothetical protein